MSYSLVGQGHLLAIPSITHVISDAPVAEASIEVNFSTSPQGAQYSYNAGTTTYSPAGAKKTPPNTLITFTAIVGLPDNTTTVIEYRWDFGDGTIAYGAFTTHTYSQQNEHTQAVLRVTDSRGRRWYRRRSVYILS